MVSSDPAHNLGDLFEMRFDNTPKQIPSIANLWVKEIDAVKEATEFMDMMNETMKRVLKKTTSVDMDVFKDLMMPGIDEVFAMKSLLTDVNSSKWDLIVFDTAPTGHTLRALTAPDFMDAWLLRMLALRKKVKTLKDFVQNIGQRRNG